MDIDRDILILVFADDISIVLCADTDTEAARRAEVISEILRTVLAELKLQLSAQKCQNFLISLKKGELTVHYGQKGATRWMKRKE